MAAFDFVSNMYDVALKPRMLRTLIKDSVPDVKHPFLRHSELQHVVSLIQTHKLLSESFAPPIDQKQVENWKSAVDAWVDRLVALVSTNMPDKCWAGICLLGLTCQECSSNRFLVSYSVWFDKLLSNIQPPADSCFVKVASCASLSDLFTRLGRFPSAKKDGTSIAGKLIQPVLKLLNEDSSEAVWDGIVQLLCTLFTFFPSSVHRHYNDIEIAIASKVMSGKCSDNMMKKLAHCLALLPKSRGDADSWSLLMVKLLYMVNVQLNDLFQGLEDENKFIEAVRLLVPPGKDPPPPLGGHKFPGEVSDKATNKPERLLMCSVSTLMCCCCTMLTNSYPVQLSVPIRSLLTLIERVLMVDGSSSHTLLPFMTAMQQELICSELPVLHSYSLELLTAVIKGMQSQLLPHAAYIVRLVIKYFKKCVLPELRMKVYSITKILLISMGVGLAVHLAEEVVSNAFTDLNQVAHESGRQTSTAYLKSCSNKKRKHASTTGSHEQMNHISLEVDESFNHPTTPISVKIAALEALEALLTVAGSLGSESWRPNIDRLLITVATNSCEEEWTCEGRNILLSNKPISVWVDFRLAALHALLASLLSPARVRPPYLAQGLELFRRGRQETGTKLAEFCAHALLALEVLIHPRSLPSSDFSSTNSDMFDGGNRKSYLPRDQRHNVPVSSGIQEIGFDVLDSDDDELYHRWNENENGNGTEAQVTESLKNTKDTGSPTVRVHQAEKLSLYNSSDTKNQDTTVQDPLVVRADDKVRSDGDEVMAESEQILESTFQEPVSSNTVRAPDISKATETESKAALDHADNEVASGENVLASKGSEFSTMGLNTLATLISLKGKGVGDLDHESSMDSFPDLVDEDPDSE